jgi:hypothetical protein
MITRTPARATRAAAAAFLAALLLAACAPPPPPKKAPSDPTKEPAYAQAIARLTALNRRTEELLKHDRHSEAAAAILEGRPLQATLLAPPYPTLAAMEAVSDLDDLYARMLLIDHRAAWARTLYARNAFRWRHWKPQTADTLRRLKQAQDGIAECDRRMTQ